MPSGKRRSGLDPETGEYLLEAQPAASAQIARDIRPDPVIIAMPDDHVRDLLHLVPRVGHGHGVIAEAHHLNVRDVVAEYGEFAPTDPLPVEMGPKGH